MNFLGKILILFGVLFVFLGIIFSFGGKIFGLGKLPGDIFIKKGNVVFYFPLTTCVLVSIVLSLIFYFISKFLK